MNLRLLMERQRLIKPLSADGFDEIFRNMSPVHTNFWTDPGSPPTINGRCDMDDKAHCYMLRSKREIVKGRFQGQSVGYVFADELELMAGAFRKTGELSYDEQVVFDIVRQEGPINIQMIKEITGMLSKRIAPVLHKLQQKFLVFEDQVDNEWDRCWYVFEQEFDINLNRYTKIEAIKILLLRFAYMNVIFDVEMAKNYYSFTLKDIKAAITSLITDGKLVAVKGGYARAEDAQEAQKDEPCEKFVLAVDKNDFLIKSNEHRLTPIFKQDGSDVLAYLLIDGELKGAILGHFRFGPHDLDDVVLKIDEKEAQKRKKEIIAAVEAFFGEYAKPLQKFMGKPL